MADRVVPMDVRAAIVNFPEDPPRGAVARFCRTHGVSRSQFYEIRKRVLAEGPIEAMAPRPRRQLGPHPQATPGVIEDLAVRVRKNLADEGLDHGPVTVRWHLQQLGVTAPATSTLARIFTRRGMVTPQPQKRPRSSYRRFQFAMVHECWQLDAFEWPLTPTRSTCVIYQVLDDRSRFLLATRVGPPGVGENATDAVVVVQQAIAAAGQPPCLLLSDNGTAFNQARRGITSQLEAHLATLGTRAITGRPYHPQTQGKDERVHQTLQRWLRAHPAGTHAELQAVVDAFDTRYNHHRPHQALGMRTPAQARAAGPVAIPPQPPPPIPEHPGHSEPGTTIRPYKVAKNGNLYIRGHIIQMGAENAASTIIATSIPTSTGTTVNIFDTHGTHLRTVTLTPGHRYYGNGKPHGRPRRTQPSTLT